MEGDLAYYPENDTYRGTMKAESQGHAEGTAILGLAGIVRCSDDEHGTQTLYAIGHRLGGNSLQVQFYPYTVPVVNDAKCQPTIPYRGGGIYGAAGSYLPLNDSRWTTVGLEVDIATNLEPVVEYHDLSMSEPSAHICSDYYFHVAWYADPMPSPNPSGTSWTCP